MPADHEMPGCQGSKTKQGKKSGAEGEPFELVEAIQFEPKYKELDPAEIVATAALPSIDPIYGIHSGTYGDRSVLILEYTEQAAFDRLGSKDALFLSNLSHPNIISLVGCCPSPSNYVVYAAGHNTTLQWKLRQAELMRSEPTPAVLFWPQAVGVLVGMCKALQHLHLHSAGEVLHGGLKASAILVNNKWEPKLCDFGRAYLHATDGQGQSGVDCAITYTAPEVLCSKKVYVRGSDIYSAGILFYTVLARREPFIGKYKHDIDAIYQAIFAEERPELPSWTPEPLKQLYASCVQANLLNRPEAKHMLKTLERLKNAKESDFKVPYSSVVYDTPVDEAAEFGIIVGSKLCHGLDTDC